MPKLFFPLFLFINLFLTIDVFAQMTNYAMGGRSWGMGNAAVTLQDGWAIYNNPAGIANLERIEAFGGYENRFGVTAFQTFGVGAVLPLSFGTVGLQVSRFGDAIYSEQKIGLAYAHELSGVSLGLKINYIQLAFQDLNSTGNITFEFGGISTIIPNLSFAAHIYNFSQSELESEFESERVPVILKAGLAYNPVESVLITIETEKDVDFPATFKAGLEYAIIPKVFLRTGLQTEPFINHFGVGFNAEKFNIDYALTTHPQLGLSHHISFLYGFN